MCHGSALGSLLYAQQTASDLRFPNWLYKIADSQKRKSLFYPFQLLPPLNYDTFHARLAQPGAYPKSPAGKDMGECRTQRCENFHLPQIALHEAPEIGASFLSHGKTQIQQSSSSYQTWQKFFEW